MIRNKDLKNIHFLTAVLSLGTVLSDYGIARSTMQNTSILAESSKPSSGGRVTALYAESESNGPTSRGRDTAQHAEGESSGPSPQGRNSALA